ncbi:MAG: anaerobic sulfatase maturase [Candidatus Merdivicinus sp.]|jgi:uncharacterized protein
MPPLNFLIKPASGNCNIRCRYCFYHDITENRDVASYGVMSEETLEILITKALETAEGSCSFGFQGGEPTLAGLDFFRKAVELQKKYNRKHLQVSNAIQTNGMVLNAEWADFLAENHFLVGLSLDGTKEIHDANRIDPVGKGTFNRVLRTAQLLTAHHVEFNVLTVITRQSARYIDRIYSFFRRSGLLWQQYIPCLDPLGEERGSNPYSLTPETFANFLKTLFDLWYRDVKAGNFIYIRYFENLVGMMMGYPPESCGLSGQCVIQNVVEADGSVYPCDFYALDEWKLGNIRTDSIPEMMNGETARRFLAMPREIPEKCRNCRYAFICRGGCRRDREPMRGDTLPLNYFCPAYEEFFAYALPRLKEIADDAAKRHAGYPHF